MLHSLPSPCKFLQVNRGDSWLVQSRVAFHIPHACHVQIPDMQRRYWAVHRPSSQKAELRPWLDCRLAPTLTIFRSTTLRPPHSPHRRRHEGFGQETICRSAAHDAPSPFLIFYFACPYLHPLDRAALAAAHPAVLAYAKLCFSAETAPIHLFLLPRPPPSAATVSRSH